MTKTQLMRSAIQKHQGKKPTAKPPAPPLPPGVIPPRARDRKYQKKARLPDKSKFVVEWNLSDGLWHGILVVPGDQGDLGPRAYEMKFGAVFQLMAKLDDMYRKSHQQEGRA